MDRPAFEVEKGKYQLAVKNPKKSAANFFKTSQKNTPAPKQKPTRVITSSAPTITKAPDKDGNNEPYLNALTTFIKNYADSPHWVDANIELAAFWERNEEYNLSARAYRNAIEKGVAQSKKPDILHKLAKNYSNLNALWTSPSTLRANSSENFPQDPLAPQRPHRTSAPFISPTKATTNKPSQNLRPPAQNCNLRRRKSQHSIRHRRELFLPWRLRQRTPRIFDLALQPETQAPCGSHLHK